MNASAKKSGTCALVEGTLRGLDREMTQQEVVRAIAREQKQSISQSYLSQIESGARPHLTNSTRMLLAKFFGVHPGYLVDDPEGFHTELISDVRVNEDQLDLWLISGAERFCARSASQPGAAEAGRACRFAQVPDAAEIRFSIRRSWWIGLFDGVEAGTSRELRRRRYELGKFLSRLFPGRLSVERDFVFRRRSASAASSSARPWPRLAGGGKGGVSPFNFGTFAAFLAWFGGTGYLLERYSNIWVFLAPSHFDDERAGRRGDRFSGFSGSCTSMSSRSIRPITRWSACWGKSTSPIRAGGTGELIYSRAGIAPRRARPQRERHEFRAIPKSSSRVLKKASPTCAAGMN